MTIVYGFCCQNFNSPVELHVAQAISSGELVWSTFYSCSQLPHNNLNYLLTF
jgi:hypothetical protein